VLYLLILSRDMTRLVLLSDIHANLPALEAVVAGVDRVSPDAVFVLGDMINGCAWPAETLDLITSRDWSMLIGNHDDAVLQLGAPRMEARYADREFYATLWWTRARLSSNHLALLDNLPKTLSFSSSDAPAVRLFHGLPDNFFVAFRPDSPEEWFLRHLASVEEPTVADGHTHFPMVRSLGRWQVINCGSVGAPFDGDRRASFALMTGSPGGWQVEIRRIEYDLERVVQGYHASGLAEEGGVLGAMFHRTVLTGQPYVSDFNWWARHQTPDVVGDYQDALAVYDVQHGPGQWAFPMSG
jgi:predicted phosphodiesterase